MIFRRFLYGIKEGTRNIFRNKMFSLASLGTIIACVFLLGTFLSVALNVRSTMQQMEQSVGISVFFEPGISAERKDQIGEEIKKKEDIATMRYVSAEEAWESYKKDVFQGNEELLEGFEGNNPLKESDSYEITLKEVNNIIHYLFKRELIQKREAALLLQTLSTVFDKLDAKERVSFMPMRTARES